MPNLRVCAVNYLNTTPLVWGMLHGAERESFDLSFRLPAECADLLAAGGADIGIVPVFELLRHPWETLPGLGIACRGAVRSILLVSRVEPAAIRTLAADTSSRTSVQLARVVLARRYQVRPAFIGHAPALDAMLDAADAALIIGDPALRLDPGTLPYHVLDLGLEWWEMTGLPMVFALWAGRPGVFAGATGEAFHRSFRHGRERMEEIVRLESESRGFPPEFVRHYLTRHIVHELGEAELQGLRLFLDYAAAERGRAA